MISVRAGEDPSSLALVRDRLEPFASVDPVTQLDLLRRTLARSTIRLVEHGPIISLGRDPEAVHDARVAVRRLRSDLRTFRPILEVTWCDTLRDELRWLGEVLGRVRDAEVLAGRLSARIATIPDPEFTAGPEIAAGKVLLDELEVTRLDARRLLLADLGSPRYGALVDRLVEAATQPETSDDDADRPASAAGSLMARPWRRLARAVRRLDPVPEDLALHGVRIRVKRVRYAAETMTPAFGKPARTFASAAKALQEVLGDHQDAVMAGDWLIEHGAGGAEPAVAFAAGRLAEHEARDRRRSRKAWPRAWERLERRTRFWS